MPRVYLARHGETDWNALGRLQGHTDVPLNDVGLAQASALANRLTHGGVTAVVTSDLVRAHATGSVVAAALGVAPPSVDAELRERSFGVFEGLTREECAARYPDAWQSWIDQTVPPEGAEPRELAAARMTRALTRASAGGGATLVVSHGGVMRIWLLDLLGLSVPPVSNGTVYVVDHDGSSFRAALWEAQV